MLLSSRAFGFDHALGGQLTSTEVGDRRASRNLVRVHAQFDQCRLATLDGTLKRRRERGGLADDLAVAAVGQARSWCMRMVPYIWLLNTSTIGETP
jgi:hypothetical protein